VSRDLESDFAKEMSKPMYIEELDRWTKKCKVKIIDNRTFRIVLTQGLNRQIRRMCQQLGYKVVELKRIRIMNINLGSLKTGQYRNVTDSEYRELVRMTGRKGDLKE
jgi:23S rRNA pseudouridine2604 synthase